MISIPASKPTLMKILTTIAGLAVTVLSNPALTVRELVAMLGALIVGTGAVTIKAKS